MRGPVLKGEQKGCIRPSWSLPWVPLWLQILGACPVCPVSGALLGGTEQSLVPRAAPHLLRDRSRPWGGSLCLLPAQRRVTLHDEQGRRHGTIRLKDEATAISHKADGASEPQRDHCSQQFTQPPGSSWGAHFLQRRPFLPPHGPCPMVPSTLSRFVIFRVGSVRESPRGAVGAQRSF